jgi:hypothetical protein
MRANEANHRSAANAEAVSIRHDVEHPPRPVRRIIVARVDLAHAAIISI